MGAMGRSGCQAAITDCERCPVGRGAGHGRGGRCPLAPRAREAGATLYHEGAEVERVWMVKEGRVVLTRDPGDDQGRTVAWAVRGAGSLLGVEGLVRGDYLDTARALGPVTVCGAPLADFAGWMDARPDARRAVLELVLRDRCDETPRRASADGSAVQRVAGWILDEAHGTRAPPIPRNVVAGLLGMLPETLSRALARLDSEGAIEVTRKEITVLDVDILVAAAAPRGRDDDEDDEDELPSLVPLLAEASP